MWDWFGRVMREHTATPTTKKTPTTSEKTINGERSKNTEYYSVCTIHNNHKIIRYFFLSERKSTRNIIIRIRKSSTTIYNNTIECHSSPHNYVITVRRPIIVVRCSHGSRMIVMMHHHHHRTNQNYHYYCPPHIP